MVRTEPPAPASLPDQRRGPTTSAHGQWSALIGLKGLLIIIIIREADWKSGRRQVGGSWAGLEDGVRRDKIKTQPSMVVTPV